MRALLAKTVVRRLLITLSIVAVIELMTGPAGSNAQPVYGFSHSFGESASFFGLLRTQRWVTFFFIGLIFWGVASFWVSQGSRVRKSVRDALALPRAATQKRPVRWGAMAVLLVFAIILPHVETAPFWQAAMVEQIAVYVLLAIGLNVVVGFAGLLDLGYVAFYAIGAYTTAWVTGATVSGRRRICIPAHPAPAFPAASSTAATSWSFSPGIIGATSTPTGIPALASASTAASRCRGEEALGSNRRARPGFRELIERWTSAALYLASSPRRSMSRVTK